MPVIQITLPIPDNKANLKGSTNGFRVRDLRDKYFKQCDAHLMVARFNFKNPPIEKAEYYAELHFKNAASLMDFDNLVARLKWPIDYLVSRGIIVDDSHKHLWPAALVTQTTCAENCQPCVKMTIVDLTVHKEG